MQQEQQGGQFHLLLIHLIYDLLLLPCSIVGEEIVLSQSICLCTYHSMSLSMFPNAPGRKNAPDGGSVACAIYGTKSSASKLRTLPSMLVSFRKWTRVFCGNKSRRLKPENIPVHSLLDAIIGRNSESHSIGRWPLSRPNLHTFFRINFFTQHCSPRVSLHLIFDLFIVFPVDGTSFIFAITGAAAIRQKAIRQKNISQPP